MRSIILCALIALGAVLAVSLARTSAQTATPAGGSGGTILVLVEHADRLTDVLRDEGTVSVGDLNVWGPNPLYDETDSEDTGATTQGVCVALNAEFDCLASETIIFADGSTLEIQGLERAAAPSRRTIVGGSGRYLGATGIVAVAPSGDRTKWTKTIEIVLPEEQ